MLSDSLRIMRHEFQNAVLEAGECVQISVGNMQAFIMALERYEGAAKEMEVVLWQEQWRSRKQKTVSVSLVRPKLSLAN